MSSSIVKTVEHLEESNYNFDGLMIETHIDPDNAWSDAKQQITPDTLKQMMED